jgi:hypothetical protein
LVLSFGNNAIKGQEKGTAEEAGPRPKANPIWWQHRVWGREAKAKAILA